MSKNTELLWYNLILNEMLSGSIKSGLTIPYLIGAKMLKDNHAPDENSIELLLNEIINSPAEKVAVLQWCGKFYGDEGINQFVIGLKDRENIGSIEKSYPDNNPDTDMFFVATDAFNKLNTAELNKIIEKLNNDYLSEIMNQNFSWSSSTERWKQYEPDEVNRIKTL